jgi:hypothetical protein
MLPPCTSGSTCRGIAVDARRAAALHDARCARRSKGQSLPTVVHMSYSMTGYDLLRLYEQPNTKLLAAAAACKPRLQDPLLTISTAPVHNKHDAHYCVGCFVCAYRSLSSDHTRSNHMESVQVSAVRTCVVVWCRFLCTEFHVPAGPCNNAILRFQYPVRSRFQRRVFTVSEL